MKRFTILLLVVVFASAGCQRSQQQPLFGGTANNNFNNGSLFANNQNGGPFGAAGIGGSNGPGAQFAGQVGNLTSQLTQFNSDNENLHAQVAALQQRLQNSNSYNDQLKQQLGDQIAQLQRTQNQLKLVSNQSQQQIAAARAQGQQGFSQGNGLSTQVASTGSVRPPTQFAGATVRANNGLMQKLNTVQLPGFKSWMDGDVIRIEGPTDRLFVSGTYQINANDAMTMANLANAIRQNFPRQAIGVEAHWDGTPIQPATTSHHQLTATQALAVFDLLVKSGLPHNQVFVMGMGSNRPRYQQGGAANRRIEIVIYPETF